MVPEAPSGPPLRRSTGVGRSAALEGLLVALATAASLLPFADKAFHIDDPLFLWVGRHVQAHPFDFYGFEVNWYGYEAPISEIVKNPPGAGWLIGIAAGLLGWSEPALHLAFLIPAVGVVLGTYALGRRLTPRPLVAALFTLWTPAFLVSSTQVMCDVPMLCLWVWALVLWIVGLERDHLGWLLAAGVLVAACALTKYFGIALIPLLLVYSWAERRRPGRWLAALLVPVAALAAYQMWTASLYGRGLLLDAAQYATTVRLVGATLLEKPMTGLVFTGGCLVSIVVLLPWLASRRVLALAGVAAAALTLLLLLLLGGSLGNLSLVDAAGVRWLPTLQLAAFALSGLICLALVLGDLARHRDAPSLLLALWVLGTFSFATFFNWSVNGRSVLPMVPAVGLLVARRMASRPVDPRRLVPAFAAAAALALVPTWADYRLANASRAAASRVFAEHVRGNEGVWFQGHWGFQYYMEAAGARPFDSRRPAFRPGDLLVTPVNNTNMYRLPAAWFDEHVRLFEETTGWVATQDKRVHAGFYAAVFGPLPFVFAAVPPEEYFVSRVARPTGAPR